MCTSQGVITCKAAVCWGLGMTVKLEEIQVDPPKSGEVRVKMLCASICHTDVLGIQGSPYVNGFPLIPGHEGVGVVETVGDEVKNLKEGDMVIPAYIGECGHCRSCVSGKTNLCLTYAFRVTGLMPDNTSRMSCRGKKLQHTWTCATWSEYTVVNASYLLKVDPGINLAHASFISCGFSTGYGAAGRKPKLKVDQVLLFSVLVIGVWGTLQIDLFGSYSIHPSITVEAISGAKMLEATKIIGIDTNEMKREKGKAFGMTDFINTQESDKPPSELGKELSDGFGVDYSFECTGVASLISESLAATKMGTGKAITIGAPNEPIVPFNHTAILAGRTQKGSVFGGLKAMSDLSIVADKCQKEEFPLQELFTHEFPLTDISKAFDLFKEPNCVKVVIKI